MVIILFEKQHVKYLGPGRRVVRSTCEMVTDDTGKRMPVLQTALLTDKRHQFLSVNRIAGEAQCDDG